MNVAEGLDWLNVPWVLGVPPKGSSGYQAVKDGPCNGWQHALVAPGERRSTIFCPYTLTSYTVRNDCNELRNAKEPRDPFRRDYVLDLMRRKWAEYQRHGFQRHYDQFVRVFRMFGEEAPAQVSRGGDLDTKKRGGKETAETLRKPVRLDSKRGEFLKWFLEADGSRSVREAMVHFEMTKSNAQSYLFILNKDHGIGYELVGDTATVHLPEGCTNPFDAPWGEEEEWLN